MVTKYPGKIDDNTSLPDAVDNITPVKADVVNRLKKAILAIENELGVRPSSLSGTVRQRLDTMEAAINAGGGGGGGGSPPGGANTDIQFNDSGVFGGNSGLTYDKTAHILSISDGLAIGAIPALTGNIRLETTSSIVARNSTNGSDLVLLKSFSDQLFLASNDGFAQNFSQVNIYPTTRTYIGSSGTTRLRIDNSGLNIYTPGDPLTFGYSTNTSTGLIRFPNTGSIVSRTVADDADITALAVTANNRLHLGMDASFTTMATDVFIFPSSAIALGINGADYLDIENNTLSSYKPIVGAPSGSSPYAVHGVGTQAMADADQTVASAIYQYNTIVTTDAITANRNLILPAAIDAAGYTKIIDNTCTGAFAIVVTTGAGVTATINNGTKGIVLIDSRGITLVGAPTFPSRYELNLASGLFSTTSATYVRSGGRQIDMSIFPPVIGILARTVIFAADIDMTGGATSVDVQLYDITHNVAITGTSLSSSSVANTRVASGILTIGTSAGNIRSDVATQYELRIKMTGGGGSDAVFITNARLVVTYA